MRAGHRRDLRRAGGRFADIVLQILYRSCLLFRTSGLTMSIEPATTDRVVHHMHANDGRMDFGRAGLPFRQNCADIPTFRARQTERIIRRCGRACEAVQDDVAQIRGLWSMSSRSARTCVRRRQRSSRARARCRMRRARGDVKGAGVVLQVERARVVPQAARPRWACSGRRRLNRRRPA